MKNIFYLTILFTNVSLDQTLIEPIESEWQQQGEVPSNIYYKDINNVLDKFVGTWKYVNTATNTVFEITFTKDEQVTTIGENNFVDELSAKFKLSINGIDQYNTYTTDCLECIFAIGFEEEIVWTGSSNITNSVDTNIYFMSMAEPAIEDAVEASDLKISYDSTTDTIIWENRVKEALDYTTNVRINNYQMPLNIVLNRI